MKFALGKPGGHPPHPIDPANRESDDSRSPSSGMIADSGSAVALPSAGPEGPSLDQGEMGDSQSASCGFPWESYLPDDSLLTLGDVARAVAQYEHDQGMTLPSDPDGTPLVDDSAWGGTPMSGGLGDLSIMPVREVIPLQRTDIQSVESGLESAAGNAVTSALAQVGVQVTPAEASLSPSPLQKIGTLLSNPRILAAAVVLAVLIPWRKS